MAGILTIVNNRWLSLSTRNSSRDSDVQNWLIVDRKWYSYGYTCSQKYLNAIENFDVRVVCVKYFQTFSRQCEKIIHFRGINFLRRSFTFDFKLWLKHSVQFFSALKVGYKSKGSAMELSSLINIIVDRNKMSNM